MHFDALAAVLVLYNPDKDVCTNIVSYIDTVSRLYIIDNSPSPDKDIIDQICKLSQKIKYLPNNDNLGIATALNQGCEHAIAERFHWTLTMDQDSSFEDVSQYLKCAQGVDELDKTAILSPSMDILSEDQGPCLCKEEDVTITSGSLLNLDLFIQIGRFEDKLFIDEVDHDYCLKAKLLDFKVIQFKNIRLIHKIGDKKKLTSFFLRRKKLKNQHNAQRLYYQTRNRLYMWQKYGKYYPQYFSLGAVLYRVIYKKIFKIISWEESKIEKLLAIFHGLRDFLRGHYGRYEK